MDLVQFLKTAIRTSAALAQLHKDNIVHQNICPQNIVIDPETGDVELIGYVADPAAPAPHRDVTGGTARADVLPYISPEQTGRMNRPVDHRTDLYSLGVTFYEMLAETLPFQASDPLGWVHCHIARPPRLLSEVAPEVPQPLSDIIMKLLSKVAEERYQSARGVERDFKRCMAELEANGHIEAFPLAAWDVWDKLQIPAKLYGRTDECASLLNAFERVVKSGVPELMLVSGYSGIGKTSVVQEVHKPIVRERGYFIAGKFEQYKRDVPYLTVAQAFRELVRHILTESEADLGVWKERLLSTLGANGQLVIEVIPQVELIIGKQPPVAPLPPTEAQNRFVKVLRDFIGVFAQREHPLALFLDDLQWADLASLKLLHQVLAHPEMKHLFVLGAYRDNEVSPSHPLITTLDEIRGDGVRINNITLGPLSLEHLIELVADTFHCHSERAEPMAKLLLVKTAGNPFFVTQFLRELYQEQLVRFDAGDSMWRWSMSEIQTKNFTENIVELMVGKLRRLPPETQGALKLAACIGNQLDTPVLAATNDRGVEETHNDLRPAMREGLILRRGSSYKFLHDRVQQAAYSLIPEEQLGEVHLRIGRLLLKHTAPEHLEDRLFDIVNHLDVGDSLITDAAERRRAADLNYMAGKKAKASSAYGSAANYFSTGVKLLPEGSWATDYALAFGLHIELAECTCLNGSFDETARLCEQVLARARTNVDRSAAYRIQMQMHTTKAEPAKSVETGIECLRLFGIELAPHPNESEVLAELRKILATFTDRSIEALIDLPLMTDPEKIAAMNTMSAMYASAFFTDANLTDLIVCQMVNTSVEHGTTGASSWGYGSLGKALCERIASYAEAYRFGKVGFDLTEKYNYTSYKGDVANFFAGAISLWSRHLNTNVEYNRIGFQAALEAGQMQGACFNMVNGLGAQAARGDALEVLYKASVTAQDFVTKAKMVFLLGIVLGIQQFAQNMRGLTDHFSTFDGDGFNEAEFEAQLRQQVIPIVNTYYFTMKLTARFLSGNYGDAVAAGMEAKKVVWGAISTVMAGEFYFFTALAVASHYSEVEEGKRQEYKAILDEHLAKLAVWSKSCPDNFLGKHALVSAEIARIEGREQDAARLYELAIRAFRTDGFVQNEASANELAARFYLDRGFSGTIPRAYLSEARLCYARWGAHGKVSQLVRRYPELLEGTEGEHAPASRRTTASAEQLDTMTAVKASHALSSEMDPEKLMTTLIRIVIEHAGAQRCCLLLPAGDSMSIAAEGAADHTGIYVDIRTPGTATPLDNLPSSLINYVRRTREKLNLNDTAINDRFTSDEYITRERPKSVLCIPIVRGTNVAGILYLENKLVRGAFVPRRLPLVEFLAAISLQNAALYDELAHENAERRHAEETLRKEAERMRRLTDVANVIPWEADGAAGQFTFVGAQAQQILGYPQEAWYAADFLRSRVHADDQERTLDRFRKTASAHGSDEFDVRFISADGRPIKLHSVFGATKKEDGTSTLVGFLFKVPDPRAV